VLGLLLVAGSIVIAVMLGEAWGWLAGWLPVLAFLAAVKLCKHGERALQVLVTAPRPRPHAHHDEGVV
jgi:hypothetical protein